MKIKQRITSTFLTIFIIISLLFVVVIGIFTAVSMTKQATQLLEVTSVTKAEHLRSYLNSQKEVITVMGASTIFRDFLKLTPQSPDFSTQEERTIQRLTRTMEVDKNVNEFFLIGKNGKVVASSDKTQMGADKSLDPYFTEGQKETFIKDVYLSTTTNNLAWAISSPIKDDDTGELLGVVVARMNIEPLFKLLQIGSLLGKTGETFIINKNLYFITPSLFLGESVVLTTKANTQNTRDCFEPNEVEEYKKLNYDYSAIYKRPGNKEVNVFRDYRNVLVLGTHAYIPETNWCLVTKVDEMEIFGPIIQIILLTIGTSILGIGIFFITGNLLSKKITKPIEDLGEGLKIIQAGNLDYKVGTNSLDEIGNLSREFDRLTQAVKQSRLDIDKKVKEQTKEIVEKGKEMEDQQKAILNILEDVDEEKQIASMERDKVNAIIQSIGDGVFVVDENLKIVLINKVALSMCESTLEEALGKKYSDILKFEFEQSKEDITVDDFIKTSIVTGIIQDMPSNAVLIRKDGNKIAIADSAAPLRDLQGKPMGCVVVFRDVTKEREIDRMKTEFISLASHQLRTPLSAMKWFSEMLLNGDAGALNKEQTDFVQNISQSNERMISLVNSLLNISRIDSGRLIIDPIPTDLETLVNQVLVEIKNKTDEKKQKIIVSVHSGLPKINIDPKLIGEVYKNLLTNANKYTPENGEISVMISKKDNDILSQVSDNGVGIPEKDQKNIFKKFFRADNIVKLETEGTGLGLYLAKSIVESSGGKIWFESKEKEGTTFWFTLPIAGVEPKKGETVLNS